MDGGEKLLIVLTTGILCYISQNKQVENLSIYISYNKGIISRNTVSYGAIQLISTICKSAFLLVMP